jgi:pyruvate ferredoxin oxidoreductase gamma subunit
MLSVAAFLHGRHSQAFPSFGSERMGAPLVAYCRIDTVAIRTHDPVSEVDCLVVQDPTLLHEVDVFSGLHADSYLLINSERTFTELGVEDIARGRRVERMLTVPATELARQYIGRPVPNTALLGGLVALTDVVPLTAVLAAIRRRFEGELADANAMAASAAAAYVRAEREAARHA